MAHQFNLGDKAIYLRRYADRPEEVVVFKVTPKGWVRIVQHPELLFRPDGGADWYHNSDKRFAHQLFPWSHEVWSALHRNAEERDRVVQEREREQLRQAQEKQTRRNAQLDHMKELIGDVFSICLFKETLPNGDRLYLLNVPTNPEYKHKGGWERALVRCKNEKSLWDGENEVCYAHTYCDERSSSFPSCGTGHTDTDENALWDVVRDLYHW